MKIITLKVPKGQLDGNMTALDLDLQTFAAVTITGVKFSAAARLIICAEKGVQQRVIGSSIMPSYQMMQPILDGILLEVASNIIWFEHNFLKSHIPDSQRLWLRHPQKWEPVIVKSRTGSLPVVVEARCGNPKHKAHISVELYVE